MGWAGKYAVTQNRWRGDLPGFITALSGLGQEQKAQTQVLELYLFLSLSTPTPALGGWGVLHLDGELLSSSRSTHFSCLPFTSLGRLRWVPVVPWFLPTFKQSSIPLSPVVLSVGGRCWGFSSPGSLPGFFGAIQVTSAASPCAGSIAAAQLGD